MRLVCLKRPIERIFVVSGKFRLFIAISCFAFLVVCSGCSSRSGSLRADSASATASTGPLTGSSVTAAESDSFQSPASSESSIVRPGSFVFDSMRPSTDSDSSEAEEVSAEKHDELKAELSEVSAEICDLNRRVSILRDDVDELMHHRGDIDSVESDADLIARESSELVDRLETLTSEAEGAGDEEIASKSRAMESSVTALHRSMSALHDNLEMAQADASYRHHTGIGELDENMDDAEHKASLAEDEAN